MYVIYVYVYVYIYVCMCMSKVEKTLGLTQTISC